MKTDINSHNFAEYFNHYISLVKDFGSVNDVLVQSRKRTNQLLDLVTEENGSYAYADGKWTIKELLVHIIDTERIFCNRAVRFARNDKTDLPGYDHDDYVGYSGANERKLSEIITELNLVRSATEALFNSFNDEMLNRSGTANNNKLTVLSIGYIMAGHETHHINILEERYMN